MPETNPQESDAVLGGQNPSPKNAVILGGFAGIKAMSKSQSASVRMQALTNATEYGDRGIDLAFELLKDSDLNVCQLARKLIDPIIEDRANEESRKILSLFPWKFIAYDRKKGIKDPGNNAYVVTMNNSTYIDNRTYYDVSEFNLLAKDPHVKNLQALFFEIDGQITHSTRVLEKQFKTLITTLNDARFLLEGLKALCIGKRREDWLSIYQSSNIRIFDFRCFLEIFPNLEVLQIYGHYIHNSSQIRIINKKSIYKKLKMLVIDEINQEAFYPIDGDLELPELEYLELGLDRINYYDWDRYDGNPLLPILSGYVTPKLKYLILRNCRFTDELISEILDSPILEHLTVLDLQIGSLSDSSVQKILDCPNICNLKFLNLSKNCLSNVAVEKLQVLPFYVQADAQYLPGSLRDYQLMRYGVSNE
ncbi:hypothetical protein [Chamaesiphon polymorphus]|uniref:Uncharacterized protein n=1 Tax=Chamaesiphon polymorphus CCALA 037 TaxID=2107692 RepID=A0A2T1GBA2_9CYAN|nr:hypothetical protein [Chamaesiphon polymorphus]PSB54589.1 hypothetical protein C7B77_17715 [Chamaesiphon polymorphus CCALA 037]